MIRYQPDTRHAFTLIELLVVITIVGVLVSITLPLYSRFTQQADETKTLSNMRQMGTALLLYAGDNNSQLPGRITTGSKWPTLLQPYVQDTHVLISPIPDVKGKTYRVTDPTKYFDNKVNYTSYIYNGFNDMGAFDPSGQTPSTFVPRLNTINLASSTILLGIPYPQANNFYMDFSEGTGNNNDVLNRTAFFNREAVYVFCDGSARNLVYLSTTDMRKEPAGNLYSDWCWLVDKTNAAVIQ